MIKAGNKAPQFTLADQNGQKPLAMRRGNFGQRQIAPAPGRTALAAGEDTIESVRRAPLVGRCRPGAEDAQLAVYLHAVGIDHDTAKLQRQIQRQCRFAAGGGSADDQNGAARACHVRIRSREML